MSKHCPRLVLSDDKGGIFVHPYLNMLAMSADNIVSPLLEEIITLPKGSSLFYLPGHTALGLDSVNNQKVALSTYSNKKIYPVAGALIPGFTRLLLPAAIKTDKENTLPQWGYTAVGWRNGRFVAAATKIDNLIRQRPYFYQDTRALKRNIGNYLKRFPRNRLLKHLVNCALNYNCRAAQNLFFGRWEAPLPVSPACNAQCIGCLSLQDSDCCVASHSRINFVPSSDEIAEIAISHLDKTKEGIVSFGQGCEGEPLLEFKTVRESISKIRKSTARGTVHLNTNGFCLEYLKELSAAGLDSVRISINSFQEDFYNAYYRQKGYILNDVMRSIKGAKKAGVFVSLNLLVFPGLTDTPAELKQLIRLLRGGYIDLIQMRNLNIDQNQYLDAMPPIKEIPVGILRMLRIIKAENPKVRFGYFNLPC